MLLNQPHTIHTKKNIFKHFKEILVFTVLSFATLFLIGYAYYSNTQHKSEFDRLTASANDKQSQLNNELKKAQDEYEKLKNEDQYKKNEQLQAEIKAIEQTYKDAVKSYEGILDLEKSKNKSEYDKQLALVLKQLSDKNYSSAASTLTALNKKIDEEKAAIAAAAASAAGGIDPASIPSNNTPPGSGFSRQSVNTDVGQFVVDVVAGDLGSTRVIVDTASDSDCRDNCPVLSLGDYVARNGAYAAINGSYFCPASYPTCAGKTNSFDLLVMGKNKHYHNSDNNVYSTNPVVVFGDGWVRFIGAASGWGRDTGVNGVLSNYPLVVSGGNVVFGGDGDPKKGSKGIRSFVASKGNTVYIGVVRNATVAEGAHALKAMGMENAMNLDSGGSTALWYGGYKAGPGRAIPNAILFVRK